MEGLTGAVIEGLFYLIAEDRVGVEGLAVCVRDEGTVETILGGWGAHDVWWEREWRAISNRRLAE